MPVKTVYVVMRDTGWVDEVHAVYETKGVSIETLRASYPPTDCFSVFEKFLSVFETEDSNEPQDRT